MADTDINCEPALKRVTTQRDFLRVFVAHEREILRCIITLIPRIADAQEILQQTAVLLWEDFETFDQSQSFEQWAWQVARDVTRKWINSRSRWQTLAQSNLITELISRRQQLKAEIHERLSHLPDCIRQLSQRHRLLLDGFYLEQLNVDSLARLSELPTEAVYTTLQQIRRQLQDCTKSSVDQQPPQQSYPLEGLAKSVSDLCHGVINDRDLNALHLLLQRDPEALDEYLWQTVLHGELAARGLTVKTATDGNTAASGWRSLSAPTAPTDRRRSLAPVLGIILGLTALLAIGFWLTTADP